VHATTGPGGSATMTLLGSEVQRSPRRMPTLPGLKAGRPEATRIGYSSPDGTAPHRDRGAPFLGAM
jgi:hypothetical protein